MAAEYAISPLDHGNWETHISISGIEKMAFKNIRKKSMIKKIDPKITNKIWKSMIKAYIEYEFRNFKKR